MKGIATVGDVEALEALAPELPASTYEVLARSAERHGKSPALSFFLRTEDHRRPHTWSYAELFGDVTATANAFHELGIRAGDVVAFVLPNLPETHLAIWGGEAAGIVFAINPLLEGPAIGDLLRAADVKVLVTLAPFPGADLWSRVQPLLEGIPTLRHVVLVRLDRHLPGLHRLAGAFLYRRELRRLHGARGVRGAVPARIGVHDFHVLTRRQPRDHLVGDRRINSSDLSSYFCTGGTTGTPKIAMRTHGNEVANAWSAGAMIGDGIASSKTLFCGLPLFHVNAVIVTGLAPFMRGAHVLLGTPQGYRGEGVVSRFWEIVEYHRVNFFSGVPTLYASLLQHPVGTRDVTSLEYGLCGAAPLPTALMRQFEGATGLRILEGYGLTEGTCVSSCNPPLGERRAGSIGLRIPLQPMKAVVLDADDKFVRDCERGEVGTLVICGPNVFRGYKDPTHNRRLWVTGADGARWLNTGDLGRQDADGYFHLTGRQKELIIRGGHNIDPACIEEPLHRHPSVQIAAAIGRPDAHAGELPVAYVELRPGADATEAELLAFARAHIPERAAVPRNIRIVPQMPLTGVGKIFKPELRLREIEAALGESLGAAGVGGFRLTASQDNSHGVRLDLELRSSDDAAEAERALAPYPFQVRMYAASPATAPGASAAAPSLR